MKRARLALTELKQKRASREFALHSITSLLLVLGVLAVPGAAQQRPVDDNAKEVEKAKHDAQSPTEAEDALWNPKPDALPLDLPTPPKSSTSPQGQTLPSPYYIGDDVQYFPASPAVSLGSHPTAPASANRTAGEPISSSAFLLPPTCSAHCERCQQAARNAQTAATPSHRPRKRSSVDAHLSAIVRAAPQTVQAAPSGSTSNAPQEPPSRQSASSNYAPVTQAAPPLVTGNPYPTRLPNPYQAAPPLASPHPSRTISRQHAAATPYASGPSVASTWRRQPQSDGEISRQYPPHAHATPPANAHASPPRSADQNHVHPPQTQYAQHYTPTNAAPVVQSAGARPTNIWPSSHVAPVDPSPAAQPRPAINLQPSPSSIERAMQVAVVYDADDLVSSLEKQYEVKNEDAKQLLVYEMRRALSRDNSQFRWKGSHLVVLATADRHATYERRLAALRATAFQELEVALCLATVDSESLQTHGIAWNVVALPVEKTELQPAELRSAFATTLSKQPVKSAVLNSQASAELEQKLLSTESFQLLGRPRFRLFNGRRANAEAGNQRAFVVGFENGAPQVRTFPVGWEVVVTPEIRDDVAIVRGHWTTSEILGVEMVQLDHKRSLQIPELLQRQMNWTHALPLGATLVLAGNRREVDGRYVESLALVRVTRANSASKISMRPDTVRHATGASGPGKNALTSHATPADEPLSVTQYRVEDILPTNAITQASALFDLCRRLKSTQRRTQPDVDVDADLGSMSIIARDTTAGHQRIQLLLGELRAAQATTLNASIISLSPDDVAQLTGPLANVDGASDPGDARGKSHLIINSADLKSFLSSAKPAPRDGDDNSYIWDLGDNGRITAEIAAVAGGRRLRIDARHSRDDHVIVECERELMLGREALLIDITPAQNSIVNWIEESQLFFRRESQRTRQYLVIQQSQGKK